MIFVFRKGPTVVISNCIFVNIAKSETQALVPTTLNNVVSREFEIFPN